MGRLVTGDLVDRAGQQISDRVRAGGRAESDEEPTP